MNSAELGKGKQADGSNLTFKKGGRTRCEKGLILLIVLLVAAVIGLIIAVVLINDKDEKVTVINEDSQVCLTPGCARAAARVLDSVDVTVDPCDDFYMHTCGKWKKTHIIEESRSSINMFSILDDRVSTINKYLLEDTKNFQNIEAVQKAKDAYTACVNQTKIEELAEGPGVQFLNKLGGWPVLGANPGGNWSESNFDLVELLVKLRQYANSPLVSSYVYSDLKATTTNILYIDQPVIGLPGRDYYLDPALANIREAYVNLATSVAVLLGADQATARADFEEQLKFETDLANITMKAEDRRDNEALYNKMTIGDLANNFTESVPGDSVQFQWLSYFQKMFSSNGVNITIDETEPIVVEAVPYFEKMMVTLQKYSRRTIANYVVWFIFQDRIGELDMRFSGLLNEYYGVLYGTTESPPRWQSCVGYVSGRLGMALGHMFVQETFDPQAKTVALDMVSNVREAFDELLEEIEWMDDATRVVAKDKADAIREWIGFPDSILDIDQLNALYENLTISKDTYVDNELSYLQLTFMSQFSQLRKEFNKTKWTTPPSTVNAYYHPVLNSIMFPAGILQPPFYDAEQPIAMNYGGIGMVIGHEITHGFDDSGRQFDKNGDLTQWWNTDVITRFKDKAQCLIDQYSEYVVPEAGLNINGINTQGENIADNGGLKQSFRAYRKWVEKQGKEERRLPGLDYTPDQLFFLNYAQIWCNNARSQALVNAIATGVHSPGQFRVIGALQNSPDFQRVFQCPSNSFMNRANKCGVW